MAGRLFGSSSEKENLLGVVIAGGLGGLLPVAIRRLIKLTEDEASERATKNPAGADRWAEGAAEYATDYKGRWKDVVRNHASAIGAAAVAIAAGSAWAMKKKSLAKTIGIVGAAVAVPRVISDYTLPKDAEQLEAQITDLGTRTRFGVVTAEELRGAPVRFLGRGGGGGGRMGVYTAEELRGHRPSSGVVRVLGGAYGANPIATAHKT